MFIVSDACDYSYLLWIVITICSMEMEAKARITQTDFFVQKPRRPLTCLGRGEIMCPDLESSWKLGYP